MLRYLHLFHSFVCGTLVRIARTPHSEATQICVKHGLHLVCHIFFCHAVPLNPRANLVDVVCTDELSVSHECLVYEVVHAAPFSRAGS